MPIRFRHLVSIGAALVFLLSGRLSGDQRYLCVPCPSGTWELGARALYFTPMTCPYAYATVFRDTEAATRKGRAQLIPCRADWGFRISGDYREGCTFVTLSYQWLDVSTTRSLVTADNVIVQGGILNVFGPGTATGQTGFEYQNAGIQLGTHLLHGCRALVYLYGDARWVDLTYRRAARSTITGGIAATAFNQSEEKSALEGGAIGIGLGGRVDLGCDVGAFMDSTLLGVIGRRSIKRARFRSRDATSPVSERTEFYPAEVCVIPEADLRIGLSYTAGCGSCKWVAEIGYEFDYFWQGAVFPDFTNAGLVEDPADYVPVCQDVGFAGLFFGTRLTF